MNPQGGQRRDNREREKSADGFEEQIVNINRVSKKTKGGNKVGFAALAVVGDKKGRVGVGLGKAPDVSGAIRKGVLLAKKHLVTVPIKDGTIPFRIEVKLGAAKLILKPAPVGSGVIAGGAVRAVVSAAGIQNISSKILGTNNKLSNVYAALEALRQIEERANHIADERNAKKK
jgi:small subunit ribosomal protein S5